MTMTTKDELRRHIRRLKSQADSAVLRAESRQVLELVEHDAGFLAADTVLLYWSLPDEVYTHDFVRRWAQRKHMLLPRVSGSELELATYRGDEDLRAGSFGIMEPAGATFTDYGQIAFALVPGMAFDASGHRLGRGKGYYDKLLPKLVNARKAGVCFSFQMLENLVTERHDFTMDKVFTGVFQGH